MSELASDVLPSLRPSAGVDPPSAGGLGGRLFLVAPLLACSGVASSGGRSSAFAPSTLRFLHFFCACSELVAAGFVLRFLPALTREV